MSSNIAQFIAETNAEIKKLREKQVSEAKTIVLETYRMITKFSPVATGNFMHNNIITVNSKTDETNSKEGKDKSAPINDNAPTIGKCKFNHNDTLTIQNHLQYADALEAGHSSQAPGGVYGISEQLTKKILNAKKVIK